MAKLLLFWHRRDLRISDNKGLAAAREISPKIVGVFCLDPNILKVGEVAPARVVYLIGCLQQLQQRYQEVGSQLLVLYSSPEKGIPTLAAALQAEAVFWNWDVEPYAKKRDEQVKTALQAQGIEVKNFWDQLLHSPEEIRTGTGEVYKVYTPYWRNWQRQLKAEPFTNLTEVEGLSEYELEPAKNAGVVNLPTAKDLGFVWDRPLILEPGERTAQQQLEKFCKSGLTEYEEQRNFPGRDGTSKLSAALKFGAIGIRTVWQKVAIAYNQAERDESRASIQTWQQELAWREFYQQAMYHFPELAEGPYRPEFRNFPWENNPDDFQAWCEGKTGYPIVDAAMRQLNQTGWMHNRCRMIVASFLTKDLIINWQWGEKYFMQTLYDGDLSANNGGWQWSASSGMDPKPLRIFNPASQAQKFDPKGEYIREWLPELRSIEPADLITGKITPLERAACGYPNPIIEHQVQQKKFKELYQSQKKSLLN